MANGKTLNLIICDSIQTTLDTILLSKILVQLSRVLFVLRLI